MKKSLRLSSRNFAISDSPSLIKLFGIVFSLLTATANAGNYTWNGATSTNWSTSSNWSPSGVPSTNDTVTLSNGGVNSILLDGNRTITRLVISANTIDLNTYELHVSGRSSLNGGAINNGNLKIRGTYAYFQGTNFNCTLDVIAGQIKFSGGTFDKTGSFEQNGSASGWGEGGCTFNDDVIIKNTGTVYLRMGQDIGDTFNGKVYLYSSGNYSLQMAYGDTSYFNDTIYINSTGSGGINFANGTYGASILGDSACLVTGNTGISAGTIQFKNMVQSASSSNSITASGSVLFNVYSNSFLGKVNFTAPNLVVKSTTFGDSTSLTKTGHSLNNTWDGANVYNGVVTITNGNTSTAYVKLASQNADTYNKDVYFNAGTGNIQAANAGTNIYNGNVIVNGNNVTFNTSGGTLKFAGEENQTFGGGTSTLTFNKIIIDKTSGNVTLNQPITIDSLLQLTSGIIYTDTIITLKATATTTGASNQSFVNGMVKKIGNTAFVFPVGDDGHHYPLEISAPSNSTDAFSVIYKNEFHNESDSSDTTLSYISTCQYWDLKRVTGTSNVKVRLYWDSLGCGVFDTVGLAVASWNGTKWVDKGRDSIFGTAYLGSLWSKTTLSNYSKITLASNKPVKTIIPTLITAKQRTIPEDIFGFNGSNIIQSTTSGVPKQSWQNLSDWDNNSINTKKFISDKYVTLMRIPAGTLSNYSDWRNNYPMDEKNLPLGWFYDQNSYLLPMNRTGNGYEFVKLNLEKMGARPIIALNMLTSTFYHEMAAFYSLNENNLPLEYIELGNEFYLEKEHYRTVFPSVNDYMDKALRWSKDIKFYAPFQNTKIAVVGAISEENDKGRKRLWLDQVLERLKTSNSIDAITLHDYINLPPTNAPCGGSLAPSGIEEFLLQSFNHVQELQNKEFLKIQEFNSNFSPKEIWITEFNLDDDNDNRTGTWAHGLLVASLALNYLETPEITKIISHTMLAGGRFGNVFESNNAFNGLSCHGDPQVGTIATRKAEKSALGTALDGVANTIRNAIKATPLSFPNADILSNSINFVDIMGWVFEDGHGFQKTIILNLSSYNYDIGVQSIYPGLDPINLSASLIQNFNNTHVILGDAGSISGNPQELEINSNPWITSNPSYISIPPFSMLVIQQNGNSGSIRNVRLTDDVICSGSTTTLVVESNQSLASDLPTCVGCSLTIGTTPEVIGNRWIYTILAGNVSPTQVFTITPCSACDPIDITIQEDDISNLQITPSSTDYCPGATPIQLAANFIVNNHGSNTLPYSYLWTPSLLDSGMVSSLCSNTPLCSTIYVAPEKTTTYEVYVSDGQCWKSESVEIVVPFSNFTLGNEINICYGTEIEIIPEFEFNGTTITPNWTWIPGTGNSTDETLVITPPLGQTTYSLELDFDGTCQATRTIIVNTHNCCSINATTEIGIAPIGIADPITLQYDYYNHAGNLEDAIISTNCPNCIVNYTSSSPDFQAVSVTGDDTNRPQLFIEGEFRISTNIDDPNSSTPYLDGMDLTLENFDIFMGEGAWFNVINGMNLTLVNCTLSACSTMMWRGIRAENKGLNNPSRVTLTDCSIENADSALYLARNTNYSLENCLFFDNFKDIIMDKYSLKITNNLQNNNDDYSIFDCTFSSNGGGLLDPHAADQKFAAIELNDVENIIIGKSGSSTLTNFFSESIYGIVVQNSGAEIWNNDFDEIFIPTGIPLIPSYGSAIFQNSDNLFWDRELVVGKSTNLISNFFTNCVYGIYGFGEENYTILKNNFGSNNGASTSNAITNSCINIEGITKNKITIDDENKFFDYNRGIDIFDMTNESSIHITNNIFGDGRNTLTDNFAGAAIVLTSAIPILRINKALIDYNDIGYESNTNHQPRIGIHIGNIGGAKIYRNNIYFHLSSTPSNVFRGIRLENANDCEISENLISNDTYVEDLENDLVGIRADASSMPVVKCNSLFNLGHSMNFVGNNDYVTLIENLMSAYDLGISLGDGAPALIGAFQGVPGGGFDNAWVDDSHDRVEGVSPFIIPWYHHGAELFDNNLSPAKVGNAISQVVELFGNQTTYLIGECSNFGPTSNARSAGFAPVAADTARYEGDFAEQFEYLRKDAAYKYLIADTGRLITGYEDDEMYEDLYNELVFSNIGKYDSVLQFCNLKNWTNANELLENLVDSNDHQNYLDQVLSAIIGAELEYRDLNSSDTSLLLEIASLHSLEGGLAVKIARGKLRLEREDFFASSSRMYFTKEAIDLIELKLWPNPAKDYIQINKSNIQFQIYDMSMRLVTTGNCSDGIIYVNELNEGYYIFEIINTISNYKPIGFCIVK
ncbi:MAG: hypothetical protein KA347_02815 [Bacteroidia bacterium]|nr:hypothetical protein [Bacteroidia bacterium]MBP7245006.1 hypothetical protein [Bacteroidia bacterium]